MGGPIALAVLDPVLAARYAPAYHAALTTSLKRQAPAQLVHLFDKPDILLNPPALHALAARFAGDRAGLLAGVLDAVKVGLAQSIHTVFLAGLGILVIGFVVVLFLPRIDLRGTAQDATPARDARRTDRGAAIGLAAAPQKDDRPDS